MPTRTPARMRHPAVAPLPQSPTSPLGKSQTPQIKGLRQPANTRFGETDLRVDGSAGKEFFAGHCLQLLRTATPETPQVSLRRHGGS
jgi:hypothetical protein